ncbi:ATP-binding protein [Metabacillus mangrovi]|nr:ATP-binding protein [Metabacillus mangrovi]
MDRMQLIKKRNRFLIRLLLAFYVLDLIFIFAMSGVRDYWIYCLLFSFTFIYLFTAEKKLKPQIVTLSILLILYGYLIMLNWTVPAFVNIMFLALPLLMSTVYQDRKLLIGSGAATVFLQLYFFNSSFDLLLLDHTRKDIAYYLMFTMLIIFFQLYYLRFIGRLWEQVHDKQEELASTLDSTKAQLELLFSQSKDAIVLLDSEFRVMAVNPAFEELYKCPEEEITGKLYPYGDYINGTALSDSPDNWVQRTDRSRDGRLLEVEVAVSPIFSERGTLIARSEIIRDITARKTEEQILIQAEKLKTAGEMAAGVAHEIRNPLTVLRGFLQILHESKPADYPYTELMLAELKRVNDIVSEFLVLSKPQTAVKLLFNLSDVLDETIAFFGTEMSLKNIAVKTEGNPPCMVEGDCNQLKQILINLLKNASDAMPNGGNIYITLKRLETKKAVLVIRDTGTGIPAGELKKIKEPFYTTKEKGTGLGLVITERILAQHGGSMEITSQEGKGTAVTLTLPCMN